MSQPLSVITPDLLKKLQADIFKYKLHGPPIFRQNIPCKYGDQCKYGRYSCIYSHESLCKYQKNNKTCLNRSCTHQHDLPLEFQLAQALFSQKSQFFVNLPSSDTQISASDNLSQSNTTSTNGAAFLNEFCFHPQEFSNNPAQITIKWMNHIN